MESEKRVPDFKQIADGHNSCEDSTDYYHTKNHWLEFWFDEYPRIPSTEVNTAAIDGGTNVMRCGRIRPIASYGYRHNLTSASSCDYVMQTKGNTIALVLVLLLVTEVSNAIWSHGHNQSQYDLYVDCLVIFVGVAAVVVFHLTAVVVYAIFVIWEVVIPLWHTRTVPLGLTGSLAG
ncbi:unnamed protein product [Ceratitis capitata]|uniref:(Mediterranean fruit fly) hypothetical protein n=1 Tax=Ceratitis capitata TaxID=7213 RepID=A0A811TX91_CERCA|nr:unnamed protein product [Ceratitis capitata]